MMRHRRFPLGAVLVILVLGIAVGYLSYMDVDVPRRAMEQVGQAITLLGNTLSNLGGQEGGGLTLPWAAQSLPQGEPAAQQAPMPVLVNEKNPVPEGYTPGNLVLMRSYCDPQVVAIKGEDIEGNREAVDALMTMLRAAIAQGLSDWQVSAGYRSVSYQQRVWDDKVAEYRQQGLTSENAVIATAKYVAKPGASEHHTGLAFDITVPNESFPLTEQSKWLAAHCWDYGFIIRYTEDKVAITGINAEPWHVRYVGLPHAKLMQERNQCLEEYLGDA